MSMLKVDRLNKTYEKFALRNVSFELETGYIMGFIGLNGAGKTTTLKSIMNMVSADNGSVFVFGKDFRENEIALKQEIGCMFGGVDFYAKQKLKNISGVVKRFYKRWNEDAYRGYLKRFSLDEDKKVGELSAGMKVKYSLALALSHNARLFIMDEPTSGLDPAARDDLLELFQEMVEDGQKSILFSTQITSDLEKCADYITYINEGEIIASQTKDDFIHSYRMLKGTREQLSGELERKMVAVKKNSFGFTGLIKTANMPAGADVSAEAPTLEDIMIYYARREREQDEKPAV